MGSAKVNFIAALLLLFGRPVESQTQTDGILEVSTPNVYKYVSLNAIGLEVQDDQTSFKFEVKAHNDAHLALHEIKGDTRRKMYEIVIGGWGNGQSVIRTSMQGTNRVSHRHHPLNQQEFRPFWVSWENGVITVGTGKEVGSHAFMSWRNPSPHDVKYIGVSTGWGSTGVWRFGEKVDGGWTEWSTVESSCSASCEGGMKTISKNRTCTNPAPKHGGKTCEGLETKEYTEACNTERCPVTAATCKDYSTIYVSHPSDCTKFVMCVRGWSEPKVMDCPEGTLWYQPYLTCWHAHLVPCDVPGARTTPAVSSCSGKRPVNGNSQAYELYEEGVGWLWKPCPDGKEFDETECDCIQNSE